jgi:hypothetical protein
MADMKYVWKITGRGAPDPSDLRQCYALAGSMREALELAGEPNSMAIPQVGKTWPGPEGVNIFRHS